MSVIVTANYKGEMFEVEIFHDGDIDFLDRDLQYEQALAEFYPPGSTAVLLYKEWSSHPLDMICENLNLPEKSLPRLTVDFAEHTLHIFESVRRGDRRPRAAIEAARDFLDGKIDRPTLKAVADAAAAAASAMRVASPAMRAASAQAAWAAAWAAEVAARAGAEAAWAAQRAAEAAGYSASSDPDSPEWQRAADAETAWQIRRFVDCMEAIGQGKDWPDMKATT